MPSHLFHMEPEVPKVLENGLPFKGTGSHESRWGTLSLGSKLGQRNQMLSDGKWSGSISSGNPVSGAILVGTRVMLTPDY